MARTRMLTTLELAAARISLHGDDGGRFHVIVDTGQADSAAAGAGNVGWLLRCPGPARLLHHETGDDALRVTYGPYPDAVVGVHGRLEVTLTLQVSPGSSKGETTVDLTMDAPLDFPFDELAGPILAPLRGDTTRWNFLVADGEGLRLRGDGSGPGARSRVAFHDLRYTLPMAALEHDAGPTLVVTAADGQDHAVELHAGTDEEPPALGLVCLPALGGWAYPRSWRISVTGDGGLTAVAGRVAADLKRAGYPLMGQADKLAARGVPESQWSAVGGSVLWAHFDTLTATLVRNLTEAGVQSLTVMGRPADNDAAAALATAGYASGPYQQTFDVFPPGMATELEWRGTYPPEGATDGWPAALIRDMQGWLDPAWLHLPFPPGERFWHFEERLERDGQVRPRSRALHQQLPKRSYRRCPTQQHDVLERYVLPVLNRMSSTAVLLDIAGAMWGLQCYSPDHPCDRRDDEAARRDILATLAETSRVVHTEGGKWWAIDQVNAFEGLFSYDQENAPANRQLLDYPEDTTRRAYEFDLHHRVPLFGLVARHAVSRTMWWGCGNDRHPGTAASKDALTALFGANPMMVVDQEHPPVPGLPRWDSAVARMRAFDALRDVSFDSSISSYHAEDGQLGRTEFATGASVEANTGFVPAGGLAPGEFVVRDAHGNALSA